MVSITYYIISMIFLTAGPPQSPICNRNLNSMLQLCEQIQAPIKPSKIEGPSTSITFLGIHLDTVAMVASITQERKDSLLAELNQLYWRRRCTKRELLSLIGKLSFACKVIPSGRIFLRRLIDISTTVEKLHYHLPLSQEAKLDLKWWLEVFPQWSGRSLILESHWTSSSTMELFTDASGNEGWGAHGAGRWISAHWSTPQTAMSIAWKELYAIVLSAHSWGSLWQRRKIVFTVITRL